MKNKNTLIVIGAVVLIAVVLFITRSKNNSSNLSGGSIFKNEKKQESGGIIGSIKEAIAKSMSFKCEYAVENNKTIVYVKGQSIKIEGSWAAKTDTGAIIKDNKLWTWDNKKKEGIIMPLNINKDQDQSFSSEEVINNLETQKQFCKVVSVPDSIFVPPADIKFQDLSKFLQQISGMPQQ